MQEVNINESIVSPNVLKLLLSEALKMNENQVLENRENINLRDAKKKEILSYILRDDDILKSLRDREIKIESLLHLLKNGNLIHICEAIQKNSIVNIVEKYEENPWHLGFIADANDFMYKYFHEREIVIFGMENYLEELNIEMIREKIILIGQDGAMKALMEFDAITQSYIKQ